MGPWHLSHSSTASALLKEVIRYLTSLPASRSPWVESIHCDSHIQLLRLLGQDSCSIWSIPGEQATEEAVACQPDDHLWTPMREALAGKGPTKTAPSSDSRPSPGTKQPRPTAGLGLAEACLSCHCGPRAESGADICRRPAGHCCAFLRRLVGRRTRITDIGGSAGRVRSQPSRMRGAVRRILRNGRNKEDNGQDHDRSHGQ